jgi:uncharacterized membrane protein YphA (DoxX/SURF4 family)
MQATRPSRERVARSVPAAIAADMADPVYRAFVVLRSGFTIAPILFGADKFFNAMTNWEQYLAPALPRTLGLSPELFMRGVGVIEIVAGVLVAIVPRYAAYVVMVWLWAIIANLLILGQFLDVALRDFAISLGALALGQLAAAVHRSHRSRLERE